MPGKHTVTLRAPGYQDAVLTVQVLPGQNTFLNNVQLVRVNPWVTVRTAIPSTAVLSPLGSIVAWLDGNTIELVTSQGTTRTSAVPDARTIHWSSDPALLLVQEDHGKAIATVSSDAVVHQTATPPIAPDSQTVHQLATLANIPFDQFQKVPKQDGWLLTNSGNAYLLLPDGTTRVVSRWVTPILGAFLVGNDMFVSARDSGLTVRSITNTIATEYAQPNIRQAGAGATSGVVSVLIPDGNLLTWLQAQIF